MELLRLLHAGCLDFKTRFQMEKFIVAKTFIFTSKTAIVCNSCEEDVRNKISHFCMILLVLLVFVDFANELWTIIMPMKINGADLNLQLVSADRKANILS
jgi:hypothetical protein